MTPFLAATFLSWHVYRYIDSCSHVPPHANNGSITSLFWPESPFLCPCRRSPFVQITTCKCWPHLPLVDGNPISSGKPFVTLDIIDTIPEVAKTLRQVHLQQISQEILQVWAEVWGKADLKKKHWNRSEWLVFLWYDHCLECRAPFCSRRYYCIVSCSVQICRHHQYLN